MSNFELSKSVMLEIYDISELRFVEFINDLGKKGLSTLMRKRNFQHNRNFSYVQFAKEHNMTIIEGEDRYAEEPKYLLLDYKNQVAIKIDCKSAYNTVSFFGEINNVQKYIEVFNENFEETGPMIRWIYDTNGNYVNVPLISRGLIKSAYPYINGNIDDYIDEYIDSNASILILLGPPGSGKTSLIKEIISRSKHPAHVSYDMKVMDGENLFTEFMTSDSMFLVLEDADNFLVSRKEGNSMMHRFLNVGDGLISIKGKKMIFSCNLENPEEIDSALLRPGRCFDLVASRPLTREEAEKVHTEANVTFPLQDRQEYTLADITNQIRTHKQKQHRVGFY